MAQPAGRPVVCRYLHPRPNTQKQNKSPITSIQLVIFPKQHQDHHSPQEEHQQLNLLLLGLLHLHSTAPCLSLLTSPFVSVFSSPSLSVPLWHGFMKSLWFCFVGADAALSVWQTYPPSKRAASQILYSPSSLWSPPFCEGQKLTRSAHEGRTLEQGHSEATWQENEWVTKVSRRALLFASLLPVLPIASQSSAETVNGWFTYVFVSPQILFLLSTVSFLFWQGIKWNFLTWVCFAQTPSKFALPMGPSVYKWEYIWTKTGGAFLCSMTQLSLTILPYNSHGCQPCAVANQMTNLCSHTPDKHKPQNPQAFTSLLNIVVTFTLTWDRVAGGRKELLSCDCFWGRESQLCYPRTTGLCIFQITENFNFNPWVALYDLFW